MTRGTYASLFWEDFYFYRMGNVRVFPSYESVNVIEVGRQGPEQCALSTFLFCVLTNVTLEWLLEFRDEIQQGDRIYWSKGPSHTLGNSFLNCLVQFRRGIGDMTSLFAEFLRVHPGA